MVAASMIARVLRADAITEGWRTTAVAATVVIPVALGVLTLVGPLSPDWARRAGTPASDMFSRASVQARAEVGAR
jgi:hypothetical protein